MDRMITSDSGRQFLKEACAAVSTESETDRFDLEGAIQALLQANRHLLRQIKAYDDVLEEGLARARGGLSIQDAMRTVPPVAARNAVEAAITELFETRRHVRRAVIAVTLQDGLRSKKSPPPLRYRLTSSIRSPRNFLVTVGNPIKNG